MKKFIKTVLAVFTALVLFAVLVLVVLSAMLAEPLPEVPDKAVLVLDLSTPITDKPSSASPYDLVENGILGTPLERVSVHTVTEAIRRAADDDRIVGLLIEGEVHTPGLSSGWAALKEVREAILRFKESGKKTYSYSTNCRERDYYVTSAAETVLIHPAGLMEFNGFAAEIVFYAGLLEKWGVEIQLARMGKYKSAVEPYVLDRMSPASREQAENLIGDLFDRFLEAVASSRNLETDTLRRIADSGGLMEGAEAVKAGLADRTAYRDEVVKELKALTGSGAGEGDFKRIGLSSYARVLDAKKNVGSTNRIAVIYAEGEIIDGFSDADVGCETLARLLHTAREDDSVKAVVLRVNSPGGSVTASEIILREILITREKKPVVVSMGSLAASGGYWIASGADEIVAEPNTITGSIGVYILFPAVNKLMNEHGITVDVVRTSPHSDMLSPYRPMTDDELALYQKLVDRAYEEFLDRVAEGRGLARDTVHLIAQGRVWSGTAAKEIGLVDALGGLEEAVGSAARRAELGSDYELAFYQEEKTFLEDLLERVPLLGKSADGSGHGATSRMVLSELQRAGRCLNAIRRLNDPRSLYARMPYDLKVH